MPHRPSRMDCNDYVWRHRTRIWYTYNKNGRWSASNANLVSNDGHRTNALVLRRNKVSRTPRFAKDFPTKHWYRALHRPTK